jgi:hypothetical protein
VNHGATAVGWLEALPENLEDFVTHSGACKCMIAAQIQGHAAQLQPYQITADLHPLLPEERPFFIRISSSLSAVECCTPGGFYYHA